MTQHDTIERTTTDKLSEPAKRWRNEYVCKHPCESVVDLPGVVINPGDTVTDPRLWPSKDVAEQRALDFLRSPVGRCCFKYLGAFPVTP